MSPKGYVQSLWMGNGLRIDWIDCFEMSVVNVLPENYKACEIPKTAWETVDHRRRMRHSKPARERYDIQKDRFSKSEGTGQLVRYQDRDRIVTGG